MNKKIVKYEVPKFATSVKYNGIIANVTFNPFDREDKDLGWLYVHPNGITIFWRKIWEYDEYEEIKV